MNTERNPYCLSGRSILAAALAYLLIPNLLFLLGWVRSFIALPLCALLCIAVYRVWKRSTEDDSKAAQTYHFSKQELMCLLLSLLLALLLTDIIGFHGHVMQGGDFRVRNPIYKMLIEQDWPLFSDRGEYFVYYHSFWLVPALICKIGGGWVSPATVLFGWMYLGISIALTVFFLRLRRHVLTFLVILFCFGRIGVLIDIAAPHLLPNSAWSETLVALLGGKGEFGYVIFHVQWVQYFNHVLPCVICLALYLTKLLPIRYYAVPAALMVLSSPMCAVSLLIILLMTYFSNFREIRAALCRWEVWACVMLLFCAALYILGQHGNEEGSGVRWLWSETEYDKMWAPIYASPGMRMLRYIAVVTMLLGPLYFLLQRRFRRTSLWKFIVISAVFFPIVWVGRHDNQLQKKGCLVMYLLCTWLMTYQWKHASGARKWAIALFLLFSSSHIAGDIVGRDFLHYTWSKEGTAKHIYDPWGGTLNHPEYYEYHNFWGKVLVPEILYSRPGEAATVFRIFRAAQD